MQLRAGFSVYYKLCVSGWLEKLVIQLLQGHDSPKVMLCPRNSAFKPQNSAFKPQNSASPPKLSFEAHRIVFLPQSGALLPQIVLLPPHLCFFYYSV